MIFLIFLSLIVMLKLSTMRVDVNACCQASIDVAGALFSPDIKLIFKPTCDELIINSNYNYIVQVLDNLLSNASKFTHEGSVRLAYETRKETNQLILRLRIPE